MPLKDNNHTQQSLLPPAEAMIFGVSGELLATLIPLVAVALFIYIMGRRLQPLLKASPAALRGSLWTRLARAAKYGLLQYKHPRYLLAGLLHIVLFAGFLVLLIDSISLIFVGIDSQFVFPGMGGTVGDGYESVKAVAVTLVFLAALIAAIRRGIFTPQRYAVPARYGKSRTFEAILILVLIIGLMLCSALFDGSLYTVEGGGLPGTLSWLVSSLLTDATSGTLQSIHYGAYFAHELIFFLFLCVLPLGKHFHVITGIPNIFFMRLDKGVVRPPVAARGETDLVAAERIGVQQIEDFSWKGMLDFYSCVDCGRCSDQCPANAAGRPLSPRFISTKGRSHLFNKYPLLPGNDKKGAEQQSLIGDVFEADEIWSCTTCGACEEECPVTIEYIDKIVDMRRGLMEQGDVPDSVKQPLNFIKQLGNSQGQTPETRGDWAKDIKGLQQVKELDGLNSADALYFVDSMTAYDQRVQKIAKSTARVFKSINMDFGILGSAETDSGHDVRRYGEEVLFEELRKQNTAAIASSGVQRIVTSDPHALNALKKDYGDLDLPVEHTSEVLARHIRKGDIALKHIEADEGEVYTYHDACYLGRHNEIYDAPREVIDAIPGTQRVEMEKSRDRSFCCGGGGLALYHSPPEEQKMEKIRVQMARKAGATCIVTACPNCNVRLSDAINDKGWGEEMRVIDVVELADQHMS